MDYIFFKVKQKQYELSNKAYICRHSKRYKPEIV